MNLDVETFLENAFEAIQPTSAGIGRVVVEPDYEVQVSPEDAGRLAEDLTQFLQGAPRDSAAIASPQGYDVEIPKQFELLRKYLRQITLHGEPVEGPWIEVAPPGNWI